MKINIPLLSILIVSFLPAAAQKTDKENYNYQRGVEAYEADNYNEAVKYLSAALEEDEKNGYALTYLGNVHRNLGNCGTALSAYKLALKYVPAKDKAFLARVHSERANAYWHTGDTLCALSEQEQAIRLAPKECAYLQGRGNIHYYMKSYAEAESDYKAALAMDTASVSTRVLLATNACAQEHWKDAIDWAGESLRRDSDCVQMYVTRTEAYFHLGKTREAATELARAWHFCAFHDDLCKWTDSLSQTDYSTTVQALKTMQRQWDDEPDYYFALGFSARSTRRYKTALEMMRKYVAATDKEINKYLTGCILKDMYRNEEAMQEFWNAYEADSSNVDFMLEYGQSLADNGLYEESLHYFNKAVEEQPLNPHSYYRRSFVYRRLGSYEAALDDALHCATLDEECSFTQRNVAQCLLRLGRAEEAHSYLEKAVRLDSVPYNSTQRMFALYCLGRKDEAEKWTTRMLAEEEKCMEKGQMAQPNEKAYLCAARLYALMGDKAQALKHLRTALELNFRDFYLLRHSQELENLQGDSAFEELLKEYSEKPATWK